MTEEPQSRLVPEPLRVLLEAGLIALLGLLLGLLANALSPRGLSLQRDYFPASQARPAGLTPPSTEARLSAHGLQPIAREEVQQLLQDPRLEAGLIVFVDARNERQFAEGHLPRAHVLDRYYPERSLPEVLSACLGAEVIVVYCGGGDCEDSEFAALMLADAGVARESLRVYLGGFEDWTRAGLPVESGRRHGGSSWE